MDMNALVTGSQGLIGSTAALSFLKRGYHVVGVDNDMRATFFGKQGTTQRQLLHLQQFENYTHYNTDIRDYNSLEKVFKRHRFDAIIHTAAQPSHDKAREIPILDFEVNALGTLNLLELTRKYSPQAVFIYTSTNKVYGDSPNRVKLKELKYRYDFADESFMGFNEETPLDQVTHSFFGVSKLSADMYVQEYGKCYGMFTTTLRLGCVTGVAHAGVKLHGFLSYLVKSLQQSQSYEIIGYKGKQVRDQIHAEDLVAAFFQILTNPGVAEVFNVGGGRDNSTSVLEAIDKTSHHLGITPKVTFINEPRLGDHICYITNNGKFEKKYPEWKQRYTINQMILEQLKMLEPREKRKRTKE